MRKVSCPCTSLTAVLIIAGVSSLFTGCKKEPDAVRQQQLQMEQETLLDQQTEELFSKIQAAENENRLEDALKLTETGIADKKFAFQLSRFLDQKVNLLLKLGREQDATSFVMEGWRTDPTNIPPAFESIARFYQTKKDNAGMIAWCKSLVAPGSPVPASRSSQIWFWDYNAALNDLNGPEVQFALTSIMREQPEAQTLKQLSDTITPLFSKPDKAAFLTPQLQTLVGGAAPAYKDLFSALILQGLATQKKWPESMKAFDECLARFSDDDLYKSSRSFFNALLHDGQTNLLQDASEKVVFKTSAKPRSINLASRHWIDCGEKFNTAELPNRLNALLSAKVSAEQVGALYDQYFYYDVNDTNLVRKLVKLGSELIPSCTDTNTVNAIKVKLLDGSFILEDYASAVKMLEAGIPGKDELWHKMSLPKVRAHLALQLADAAKAQKDTKTEQAQIHDAIKNFRIFMDGLRSNSQDEEYDPTTGVAYCKEWILARNSKRIADLYTNRLHDEASAAKEIEKAKENYRAALKKTAGNAESMAILVKEVKPYGLKPEPAPAKGPAVSK